MSISPGRFFRLIIFTIWTILISSCTPGQEEDVKPEINFENVFVHGAGEFSYLDSLTYVATDTNKCQVRITTKPSDADLYYSTGDTYTRITSDWITIDTLTNRLKFYAIKEGYAGTAARTLNFSFQDNSSAEKIKIHPHKFEEQLNIGLTSNTRGKLHTEIYDRWGKLRKSYDDFISTSQYKDTKQLKDLENNQPYIIKIWYGRNFVLYRLFKTVDE